MAPNKADLKVDKLRQKFKKGYIDSKKRETIFIRQKTIASAVDITNASKHFELELEHGPYRCKYFRSGRHLLLGGRKGHVAAVDWLTKDLICEFNIRETVHAVQWLHVPSMFAVAQKDWVHVYDKDGIELNVIKSMYRVTHLDFLEHHFLLASASDKCYISWKDVSIGKDIASFPTKKKITGLTHNIHNGVLAASHPNGTISMWTPNYNRPVMSMLCHPAAVRGATISVDGNYLATTGIDKTIKIWDLRNNYQCLKQHSLYNVADSLHFSQLNMLAVSSGKSVAIYKDACRGSQELTAYLRNNVGHIVSDVYFCNYEDVLGVGHEGGFTSLLVPGSGEPNFDSLESNPYTSKSAQREMEVKMLLDKVSHEMISLD